MDDETPSIIYTSGLCIIILQDREGKQNKQIMRKERM
jgi:hypothetical protein